MCEPFYCCRLWGGGADEAVTPIIDKDMCVTQKSQMLFADTLDEKSQRLFADILHEKSLARLAGGWRFRRTAEYGARREPPPVLKRVFLVKFFCQFNGGHPLRRGFGGVQGGV